MRCTGTLQNAGPYNTPDGKIYYPSCLDGKWEPVDLMDRFDELFAYDHDLFLMLTAISISIFVLGYSAGKLQRFLSRV